MNRHERRSLDAIHRKFLGGLPAAPRWSEHEMQVRQEFIAWLEAHRKEGIVTVPTAYGVLGESQGSDAYIKETIEHPDEGVLLKFWGISYPFKGRHNASGVHGMELAKCLVSEIPRQLARLPFGRLGLLLDALLFPKRFILFLDHMFYSIATRFLRWHWLPDSEYNRPAKELRRAGLAVLARHGYAPEWEMHTLHTKFKFPAAEGMLKSLLFKVVLFVAHFLQQDTAYMFRVQDAFGTELYNGIGRFWEGLDTAIAREVHGQGIAYKWKFVRFALKIALWRYPEVERFLDELMDEVCWDKVKMDDADWYFCLGYVSYNFGGMTKEERFAERERIDKEKQHVILYA